jgi:two-component system OmpR family sensor kinase
MAAPQVEQKWRPPLSWIVFAVLLAILMLPAAIVIWFRALDNTPSQMGPIEITALLIALVLTLIVAAVFSRTVTRPINELIARTHAIGSGNRAAIAAPHQHGTREIAVLSQSFLDLAERLVQRTEYVSSFAAHVSHELKSPLTSIRGSAELLLDERMSPADRERFLTHIIADADRLAGLLDRLRDLARAEVPLDARGATIAQMAEQLQAKFPDISIHAVGSTEVSSALSLEAAAVVLGQLAANAVQHGATELTLLAERSGVLRLTVSDNGRGIAAGNWEKVFEPFFTTRRDAGGTGMGLQIARSMVEAHGGTIDLLPSADGASFELRIPLLSGS